MKRTLRPIYPSEMAEQKKSDALNHLLFLKDKSDKTIKARFCAGGCKQRAGWNKRDVTSTTAALESILSCIDALEGRNVAMMDIPKAFLTADMDKEVNMMLRGILAELMVDVETLLCLNHMAVDNGRKVLYVRLKKALYGTLWASLLFYEKFLGDLQSQGF